MKNTAKITVEGFGFKKEVKYKVDWKAEALSSHDEINRLRKLIDRYGVLVVMLVAGCVAALILGITIGRSL